MNATARTAKLRNIRLALTQKFQRQDSYRPEAIAGAVHATMLKLTNVSSAQLRQFARLVGA